MKAKIVGMIESDYDGMCLWVTALRVGAVALVLDKSTDELNVGTIAEVVTASRWSYGIKSEEILCGPYDATGEFITDDEVAYVGINYFHECEDRKTLRNFYEYLDALAEMDDEDLGEYRNNDAMDERNAERDRHIVHRSIKHRMYAERVARRNARKGVVA